MNNKNIILFIIFILLLLLLYTKKETFYSKKKLTKDILYTKTTDWFVNKLETPLCLVRYNDGEWFAMLGKEGSNCDHHKYFPEMGKCLRNAITNKNNISDDYVFQSSWYGPASIENYNKLGAKVSFCKNDHIHTLSRSEPKKWIKALDILHKHPIILIASENLNKCNFLSPDTHIVIPKRNCYLKIDKIIKILTKLLKNKKRTNVIICASMTTNCIIDRMYNIVRGKHSLLDFGSSFDLLTNTSIYQRLKIDKRIEIQNKYKHLKPRKWDNTNIITI